MNILIADSFDQSLPQKLSQLGTIYTDFRELNNAHILIVKDRTICNKKLIDSAPSLKMIITSSLDNIDTEYAKEKHVIVKNIPATSAVAVAELTFALLLSVTSRIPEAHLKSEQGDWQPDQLVRSELAGKTLCLIGIGAVGCEVAKRAACFGLDIVIFRKSPVPSQFGEVKKRLSEAVRAADFISLHLPVNLDTKWIIHSRIINDMKKGAVLINTSHADCIVAEDVAHALEKGQLSAYATDVWPQDPPPAHYPILFAPNVIKTPHIGSNTKENLIRAGDRIFEIIEHFAGR